MPDSCTRTRIPRGTTTRSASGPPWTVEKGFDREGFLDAFLERTEKNFRDSGQPWSADVAAAVRSYGEGRWTDIEAILEAGQGTP